MFRLSAQEYLHEGKGEPTDSCIQEIYSTKGCLAGANYQRARDSATNEPVDPVRGSLWRGEAELWLPSVFVTRTEEGIHRNPAIGYGL